MKEQRITIEIDHEGRITADAEGFTDDACLKELDRLLERLAAAVASIDRKPQAPATAVASRANLRRGQETKR